MTSEENRAGTLPPPAEAPRERPSRRQWIGLAALLTGTFVIQVDFFIVNVALPTIQRDLSASLSQVQLVAVSYGGAFAITVVAGGRLGDLFGRKKLFMIGLVAFAAASAVCGLAESGWVLVGARIGQGVAAAMVMPQTLGSLHATFSGHGRDRAFAIFGVSMGLAWVSGIVLGGLLVGANIAHLGWRVIFLINLPLVALTLFGAARTVSESTRPVGPTLDLVGLITFGLTVALLVFPLIQGRQSGWPLWAYLCLGLSAAVCAILVLVEMRVHARGHSPVISPELFRDRNFRFGLLVIVVFFLGPPGFFLLTTLYLQLILGFSATQASLTLLPFGAVFVISSHWVKRLKERWGENLIVIGAAIMMIGLVAFIVVVDQAGSHLTVVMTTPEMSLIGMGQAFVTTPLYEIFLRNVSRQTAATASGIFTTVQVVAQSVSVAVLVIIFTAFASQRARSLEPAAEATLRVSLSATGTGHPGATAAVEAYRACTTATVNDVVGGSAPRCAGSAGSRQAVAHAVQQTVSAAARTGYTETLLVNILFLVASGGIMAVRVVRTRRLGRSSP